MSNKIIQITEENLRKAVESGDLKQLAPEVFEKKKMTATIFDVSWKKNQRGEIFPEGFSQYGFCWVDLLNKPPMLMTLEWEE